MTKEPEPPWKTGSEVLELADGRYAVDMLDGTYAVFRKKKHAQEYIGQQNAIITFARRPEP